MQYRVWQVVSALLGRVPPGVGYAVATVVGFATYYCWPRGRRAMHRNFRHVLGPVPAAEVRRVARRSLINYCKYLADFVRFPSLGAPVLLASVAGADSFAALDETLANGKGAIIVCTHFGNWDLGAGAAAARGYPITVVAETFADPRLDARIVGARRAAGMKVVKHDKAAPSLVRSLHRNGLLALLIDRPTPGDGVRVRFFDADVDVPAGPARLALRTGAAVVPTAFARVHPNRLDVMTLTDFSLRAPATYDELAIHTLTQAIMSAHERFIRRYPDQWYMFREMWPPPAGHR